MVDGRASIRRGVFLIYALCLLFCPLFKLLFKKFLCCSFIAVVPTVLLELWKNLNMALETKDTSSVQLH